MIGALWTGISGLRAAQRAIDNESNNVANVNTVGYKASRVSFADMMYQDSIGKGVSVTTAEKQYIQGSTKSTDSSYDVALDGDGFLVVRNVDSTGTSETAYTRAGNLRRGQNGTLQDANGYEVQGWAMSPLDPTSDVISTNSNWTSFNQFFTEIAGNQIIKFPSRVETYSAKMTDYTETVKTDNEILTGSGIKRSSDKVSDIQALQRAYREALSDYANTPQGPSSSSTSQVTRIDLPNGTTSKLNGEQEKLSVYINGKEISVEYVEVPAGAGLAGELGSVGDLDGATPPAADQPGDYDVAASRIATYKALADEISRVTGLEAYTVDSAGNPSTDNADVYAGSIMIRSVIPGEEFVIGDVTEQSGTTIQGTSTTLVENVKGQGQGAVNSAMQALRAAVAGKQYDLYKPEEITTDASGTTVPWDATAVTGSTISFVLNIDGVDYTVSSTAGAASPEAALADLVANINGGIISPEVTEAVSAEIINGQLVITSNTVGEEFTGEIEFYDPASGNTYTKERNLDLSGNTGAGAEFMQIVSTLDQETSLTSLQLQLSSLGLTDEAFADISIDDTGLITVSQDGVKFVVGQLAIAQFSDNMGLRSIGGNLLLETVRSGAAKYTIDNDNSTQVKEKELELSRAELSDSLVNLMVFQRAFEANSKSITTSDELLTTLIQLKR